MPVSPTKKTKWVSSLRAKLRVYAVAACVLIPKTVCAAPPENDNFTSALSLPGTAAVHATGSNLEAFLPDGEYEHPRNAVWWTWTAPASGVVQLDVSGSNFAAAATAWLISPAGGPALDHAVWTDRNIGFAVPAHRFYAEAGATYAISVGTYGDLWLLPPDQQTETGMIDLRLTQPAPGQSPANDLFVNAAVVSALNVPLHGDLALASAENETFPKDWMNFHYGAQNRTVWYRWTAPSAGHFGVILDGGPDGYPRMDVFRGAELPALQTVAAGIGSFTGNRSSVGFTAASGDVFYFHVGEDYDFFGGPHSIEVRNAPANDDFAGAEDLGSVPSVRVDGTTLAASAEPLDSDYLDPWHSQVAPAESVWYKWTPSLSGPVALVAVRRDNPLPEGVDAVVFSGDSAESLVVVPHATSGTRGAFTFEAVAGTAYRIAILTGEDAFEDGYTSACDFTLHLSADHPLEPYEVWLLHFPSLTGAAAARNADPDGDGRPNLLELTLGTNPLIPDSKGPLQLNRGSTGVTAIWYPPSIFRTVFAGGTGYGTPIDLIPETSTNGVQWTQAPPESYKPADNYSYPQLTFLFSSATPRLLIRLRASDRNHP